MRDHTRVSFIVGSVTLCLVSIGCTWVPLAEGAAEVRVASPEELASCKRVGGTTATVAGKAGVFFRGKEKVREELETLARNEAVTLKGDTVSPETPVENGSRKFGVYRCGPT